MENNKTDELVDKIGELKRKIEDAFLESDVQISEPDFERFLRAKQQNVDDSFEQLSKTIEWREKMDMDNISTGLNQRKYLDVLRTETATGKSQVRGFDKEGRAIYLMRPRNENTFDFEGNIRHVAYMMERCDIRDVNLYALNRSVNVSEANGQEKVCVLVDYKGLSFSTIPPMSTSLECLNIFQTYYPERLGKALLVNPPWIFEATWTLLKPFIDDATKEKIVFIRKNVTETLEQFIDLNQLEEEFGGSSPFTFDPELFLTGGEFHEEYNAIAARNQTNSSKEENHQEEEDESKISS